MKKIFIVALFALVTIGSTVFGQLNISKIDKISSSDEMFIDMAVLAAKKSVADGGTPNGAVVIVSGTWKSTGVPADDKTAEIVAFEKSRKPSLEHATIYTVNEPTTATLNLLNKAGVESIYFVNPRNQVVAAGIYPASAYDDTKLDSSVKTAPLILLPYPDGQALLTK